MKKLYISIVLCVAACETQPAPAPGSATAYGGTEHGNPGKTNALSYGAAGVSNELCGTAYGCSARAMDLDACQKATPDFHMGKKLGQPQDDLVKDLTAKEQAATLIVNDKEYSSCLDEIRLLRCNDPIFQETVDAKPNFEKLVQLLKDDGDCSKIYNK